MSELFADDYPTRSGRCGMSWIIPASLVIIGLVVLIFGFRYFGGDDHH